ncbi:MAG: hypothetical protein MJE77_06810 [Proteobacteria bacterium]|nr:hypothetical protein [Pseudomonadota bacterium]
MHRNVAARGEQPIAADDGKEITMRVFDCKLYFMDSSVVAVIIPGQ